MSFCQCGRVLPWKVHGQTCSCVCAMRYISARACACSHSLFVFGWPFCFPHLSLFSCTVRNICPKLVQSRSQFTEQITHLITSTVPLYLPESQSWVSMSLPPNIIISLESLYHIYMPPEPLFHQTTVSCFPSEILFPWMLFWSSSSFKEIEGVGSSLWH